MKRRAGLCSAVLLLAAGLALAESPPSYLGEWGGTGTSIGKFRGASGIAIDGTGRVFVADAGNRRIQVFDAVGTYLGEGHSAQTPRDLTVMPDGSVVTVSNSSPFLVRFTADATIFFGNSFTVTPSASASYGCASDSRGLLYATGTVSGKLSAWAPDGTGSTGPFEGAQPAGIAVGPGGDVFVTFAGDNLVRRYSQSLAQLSSWGSGGSGPGQFNAPYGIAVDRAGDVYVADTGNDRVEKFTATGGFLCSWGTHGSGSGQFNQPVGVEVDPAGVVYVSDLSGNRVQRFGYEVVPGSRSSWGRIKTLSR